MTVKDPRSLLEILAPIARPAPASKGTDLQQLRRWNRLLVLNCVREHGGSSRAAVAELTGLSRPTVTSIVDALMGDGLLTEGPSPPPAPGQRGRMIPLHFNARAGTIIGVDMGRNHLTVVLSDLAANIMAQVSRPFAMSRGPAVCRVDLSDAVRALVQGAGSDWGTVVGIGVGLPGPLDATLSFPVAPPGMPEWDGVRLRDQLQADLSVPVYLDNNANMGALGENRYGSAHQIADLLYMKLDSGIGCGFIIDRHLYRGGNGSAGEIGHIPIAADGAPCVCGNRGCLETVASIEAIIIAAQAGSAAAMPFEAVIAAAQTGNGDCHAALTRAGTAIGTALATVVNILNPTMIVLDGKTMLAGDLILAPTRAALVAHSLAAPRAHAQVVRGTLASQAVSLGAVATVLDSVFIGHSALA
ncbi:MAG: ROK family transcriptional regulator [Ktedonobacterales bacterium]|nr:ROK family transcriptional regulator [Ktedonobacterales bacterium]